MQAPRVSGYRTRIRLALCHKSPTGAGNFMQGNRSRRKPEGQHRQEYKRDSYYINRLYTLMYQMCQVQTFSSRLHVRGCPSAGKYEPKTPPKTAGVSKYIDRVYKFIPCRYLNRRTTRAGLPATTTSGSTSRITTLPAPTTERGPISTWSPMRIGAPSSITQLKLMKTPRPMNRL